jgi:hypothetical protein
MIKYSSRIVVILLLVAVLLAAQTVMGQESLAGLPIQFSGRIAAVDGSTLTVNQLQIDASAAQVSTPLQVNSQIVIRGVLLGSGVIIAQSVSIYIPPTALSQTQPTLPVTPPPAIPPTVSSTAAPLLVEGTVQAIAEGMVVVNNMNFQFDRDDPILDELRVGDVLRIEGSILQVGDEPRFTVTSVTIVSRASDEDGGNDNDDEDNGMGMGMGMGD